MAKKDTGAALAKPQSGVMMAESAEMPADWLSDILGDAELGVTGTEEMDQSDVRLPAWLLNSKKEDKETGRQAPDDTFWNSITERTKDKLRLTVLTNHKSRLWREEDASGDLVVRCSSWDGEAGEMQDGTRRQCKGCPDYEWRTDADGKRKRNCTDIYNLICLDRDSGDVCVIKVKKAAIKGFRLYYQEHFHKKRHTKVKDKKTGREVTRITDIPFFAAETIVTAEKKTGPKFTWYEPKFTFGGALPREDILGAAEIVKTYLGDYLDRASKTHDDDATDAIDTTGTDVTPNADDFRDDGTDYGDSAPAAPASPNRF